MTSPQLRSLVALLSLAIAGTILALTLGLWERSRILLNELLDVVGRHTWIVEPASEEGVLPPSIPFEDASYNLLERLPGLQRIGLETGIEQVMGTFNHALNRVNANFFSARRYKLSEGHFAKTSDEAVVGANLSNLLGTSITVNTFFGDETYTVVGILESVSNRDMFSDDAVYLPLEAALGPSEVRKMYIEVSSEYFTKTKTSLESWLKDQGLKGYKITRLADQYGLQLREKVARLLGGALGFGVIATLLIAGTNLISLYFSQILGRIRQLGIRRAVGASQWTVIKEEVGTALPWAIAGLLLSLPLIYFGNIWLQKTIQLSATPGLITLSFLVIAMLGLITLSALLPARWGAMQPPAQSIRGLSSNLLERRFWLAGVGLTLGVISLTLQASTAQAATLETKRILGKLSGHVAIIGAFDIEGTFADPRAIVSLQLKDYQAFLNSPLAAKFSRHSYIRGFPVTELQGSNGTSFNTLMVYTGDYLELAGIKLLEGQLPNSDELELLLGKQVAEVLFSEKALGQQLSLFGREWKVVGIFQAGELGIPGGASDSKVLAPGKLVRPKGEFNLMAVEVAEDLDVNKTLLEITDFLTAKYDSTINLPFRAVRPENMTSPDIVQTLSSLSKVYQALALALLLLGGAGLASQLLVALSSRIREIGIRRATGASQMDIFRQFLFEALKLGLSATGIGLCLGIIFSYIAAKAQAVPFSISIPWALISIIVGLVVSLIFGIAPSYLAAKLQPATAIRDRQ
jgi:putative ABC transport system permease protein